MARPLKRPNFIRYEQLGTRLVLSMPTPRKKNYLKREKSLKTKYERINVSLRHEKEELRKHLGLCDDPDSQPDYEKANQALDHAIDLIHDRFKNYFFSLEIDKDYTCNVTYLRSRIEKSLTALEEVQQSWNIDDLDLLRIFLHGPDAEYMEMLLTPPSKRFSAQQYYEELLERPHRDNIDVKLYSEISTSLHKNGKKALSQIKSLSRRGPKSSPHLETLYKDLSEVFDRLMQYEPFDKTKPEEAKTVVHSLRESKEAFYRMCFKAARIRTKLKLLKKYSQILIK